MYGRVVVAVDGSETAEAVLPAVESLAGALGAELVLLRVVPPISAVEAMAAAGVVAPEVFFMRALEAKRYLTDLAARAGGRGLRVRTALRHGSPAPEIVAAAIGEQADLIAMATHGRRGFERLVLGSVAEAVLRTAPMPVLLVRVAEREDAEIPSPAVEARR